MRTQSVDTSPEAERILIGLIRKAPITKRFDFVRSWSQSALQLNRQNIQKLHPQASKEENALTFVTHHYGSTLADSLQAALEKRPAHISDTPDILAAITPIAEVFEQLSIAYYFVGQIAISIYGMQRAITSIDIFADIQLEDALSLFEKLEMIYSIDKCLMQEAIQNRTSFNGIHLESILKIDMFLAKNSPFDQQMRHRVQTHMLAENGRPFCIASPEDVILTQLDEYRNGGEVADDQYNDILGILKVQGTALDLAYLQQWAITLRVADLLGQACIDAGLNE